MTNPSWLKRAAERSKDEAWTLGRVFARYRQLERRSPEELSTELGCSMVALQWLSLCRRPEGEKLTEYVSAITKRFEVDPQRLTAVLRRVEVMDALSLPTSSAKTSDEDALLLAARDRSHDEEGSS